MKKLQLSIMFSLGLFSTTLLAQDTNNATHDVVIQIPEVALLDLESDTGDAITLGPTAPTEAGEAVTFPAQDNSIWLNYSSIVGSLSEPSRNISVQITTGVTPAGTILSVTAGTDAGGGDGNVGSPVEEVVLSNEVQDIITNIGSSYTGDGVNKGHNLLYSLNLSPEAGSYALLDFDNSEAIEITYTLSDN